MSDDLPQKLGEDFVAHFCERSFLADFVFRNPEQQGKRHSDEVTDSLVWIGDAVVILQVKSFDPLARAKQTPAKRMASFQKQRVKVEGQLTGAFRNLCRTGKLPLVNDRRGTVAFDASTIRQFFGFGLLDDVPGTLQASPHTWTSGQHTLTYLFMSTSDFGHFATELSTASDLLDYLTLRFGIASHIVSGNHSELDILATIRINQPEVEALVAQGGLLPIKPGAWADYYFSQERLYRDHVNQPSHAFDHMVAGLHRSVATSEITHLQNFKDGDFPRTPDYILAASELAKVCRAQRRAIVDFLIKKSESLSAHKPFGYFCLKPKHSCPLVFIVSNLTRQERRRRLGGLTQAAKLFLRERRIVGIAMDSILSDRISYDSVLRESDPTTDAETASESVKQIAQTHFAQPQVLEDYEYPEFPASGSDIMQ